MARVDLEEFERGLKSLEKSGVGWARQLVALIARIRELELVATQAADVFEAIGASPGNEDLPTWAKQIRECVEKGVVLP